MPKLRVFSGAELCNFLTKHGFEYAVRGRRRIDCIAAWEAVSDREIANQRCSFPVPLHRQLDRGTLRGIIRQTGLPRSLFE